MVMDYPERPDSDSDSGSKDELPSVGGLTAQESSALDAILARIRAGKHADDLTALTDTERKRLEFMLFLRNNCGAFDEMMGLEE